MPVKALVYVSKVSPKISPPELEVLVNNAQTFNRTAGVSGVLLFDGARYLQYLEGPEDGVTAVYGRIHQATRHTQVEVIAQGHAGSRYFPYWPMKKFDVDPETFDAVAQASWAGFAPSAAEGSATAVGRLIDVVGVHPVRD